MVSVFLNSDIANQINIKIMRALIALTKFVLNHREDRVEVFKDELKGYYILSKWNSGKLFIASFFRLSTARVYFSVCFNPL